MSDANISPEDLRALQPRAPHDAGRTANEFAVLKWDADTAHQEGTLPAEFSGRWVVMYATGGIVHFAFSKTTGREVDRTVASGTTTGASTKVGGVLADGVQFWRRLKLPYWQTKVVDGVAAETLYFVRESTVDNSVVYMELSDLP